MPRTRAMGESPTGFRSLDMHKPTRRRKAAQSQGSQRQTRSARSTVAVRDKSDQTTNPFISSLLTELKNTFDTVGEEHERPVAFEESHSSPSKRKSADTPDEQRSAKRTRVGEIAADDKLVLKPQPEASAKNLERTFDMTLHSPPTNSLSQNNLPDPLNNQLTARVESTSVLSKKTLTKEELLEKQQLQQTFHNIMRLDPALRPKYEKSLSDCDEDEWYPQFQQRMMDIPAPILPSKPNAVTWDYDSKAMFLIRTDESKGSTIMRYNSFCPPPSQVTTRLLTQDSVIVAVSTSLDWFEKNPGGAVPTAEEMSSLLENLNQSKQAEAATKQIQSKKSVPTTPYAQRQNTTGPITPTPPNTTEPITAAQPKTPPATTTPSESEHLMVQAPSSDLPSSQAAEESRSWASALGASAANFIRSPLSVFRSPNRRQVPLEKKTESASTLSAVNSSVGIALLGEATRPSQLRRAPKPAAPRALQETETELEGRLALERSSREAEASRTAQTARVRVEGGAVEDRVKRKTPVASTPTFSNTFSHPEYSDSDSDEDEEDLPGLTRCGAQPLWIPRGYKSLAAGGECNAGTEFDLPKWVKIRSPEEAIRLAEAWNDRVLGPDHRVAEDLRAIPTVRLRIPLVPDSWLSQEEMADRFACQQEFEKLGSMWDRTDDPESLAELNRRKTEKAEEAVRQRKECAKLEEARPRADRDAEPSNPSPNPLLESSGSRINRSLLKARAKAERYKPKVPSGLRVGKNMSPIQENNDKAHTSQGVIDDQEVISSMTEILDEDIVAEEFPQGQ